MNLEQDQSEQNWRDSKDGGKTSTHSGKAENGVRSHWHWWAETDPTLQTGQNVTTWSLEKKNVDLDGVGDFLGAELKPALQFQGGFSLTPLEIYRSASFDQIL